MSDENIQPYVDDILDILSNSSGEKVTREELERELKKFLEYGVPLDHAKQTLIKKFGGLYKPISTERTLIVDLKQNQNSVNLLCRVITINPKEVTIKDEVRKIFYGILSDESGSIPFTAWNDFEIEKGSVIQISNAYTKEWQGDIKLNLGDRTKVEKTDESKIPESSLEPRKCNVEDLKSGLGAVEVTARIIEIMKREVEVENQKKNVYSGTLGDKTGKANYTSWHDFKLKEGDVVKISGGYVKSWKGIPQLTFDEKATVEKLDSSKISKEDIQTRKIPLHELVERFGALDIQGEGTVIQIREGSGVIQRCPECNRVIFKNECSTHGKVKGLTDLRIKLIIDDGTGAVSGIINKESSEKILGKTLDELVKMLEKSEDKNIIIDEINKKLFAHRINLRGNALGDEFGITIIAQEAKFADINIEAESERLSQELEELL